MAPSRHAPTIQVLNNSQPQRTPSPMQMMMQTIASQRGCLSLLSPSSRPASERRIMEERDPKKKPIAARVHWKNFLPKKLTIPPKTIIRRPRTQGCSWRKATIAVEENLGHASFEVMATEALHSSITVTELTMGVA